MVVLLLVLLLVLLQLSLSSSSSIDIVSGIIIGSGRVGSFLHQSNHFKDTLILKNSDTVVDETSSGPIYVCSRNEDLQDVVERVALSRRSDIVFLQNGMLEGFLQQHQLQNNTQALIYFSIPKKGDPPKDNHVVATTITGKWGEDFCQRLHNAHLACNVVVQDKWQVLMFEKLLWMSSFMLVGANHYGCTVGKVVEEYPRQVVVVVNELAALIHKEKGIVFSSDLESRMFDYARTVSDYPTAFKEFKWRNGWFFAISKKLLQDGEKDVAPTHTALLKHFKRDLFA